MFVFIPYRGGSAFRSYGSPQSFLASESLMDDLAAKLGKDPLELRYLNVYRPGDTTPTGQGSPFPVYMYGVFMAEVAVDTATGKTAGPGASQKGKAHRNSGK